MQFVQQQNNFAEEEESYLELSTWARDRGTLPLRALSPSLTLVLLGVGGAGGAVVPFWTHVGCVNLRWNVIKDKGRIV